MYLYELINVKSDKTNITAQTRDTVLIPPSSYKIVSKLAVLSIAAPKAHELLVTLDVDGENFMDILKVNEALSTLAQECENTQCNECRFYIKEEEPQKAPLLFILTIGFERWVINLTNPILSPFPRRCSEYPSQHL